MHTCHWPGCNVEVPPKYWGCQPHWRKLPYHIRENIWRTYRPGQETTKDPSPEYLAAAQEAQEWIVANFPSTAPSSPKVASSS